MTEAPLKSLNGLNQVPILTAQTYTESILNDRSIPDGHSDNLYGVLTLTARPTRSHS